MNLTQSTLKLNLLSKADFSLVKRAMEYVKPYKIRFLVAFLLVLSGIGFGLVQPLISAKLLASFFDKNYGNMITMVMYMGLFFVFSTIVQYMQQYVFSTLNQNMIYDIKSDMFSKILDLPIKAFDNMRAGEFMSRLNNDASVISNVITGQFLNSIVDVFKVLIIGVVMFFVSVKLSLLVFISFPLTYFSFKYFGKILRKKQGEMAKINDSYFSNIQESVGGIREIKCMGIKPYQLNAFLLLGEKLKDKGIKLGIINAGVNVFSATVQIATEVLIILVGFYLVSKGELTVVMYLACASYVQKFGQSLMALTKLNSSIQQALVSIKRIFELLDNMNYSVEKFGKVDVVSVKGEIKFENVYFNYDDNAKVLEGISFIINPNRKVAFVGGSGVGKTTLLNLLLRFYNPLQGNIEIDGINIADYSEESLRRHISVVRQETFLFNMSLKENLLLADPHATMEEMITACTSAHIHEHIASMPMGYDTIVGERGVKFSGGQRQRVAIARAILKRSKIILFDEATSALDNESQYAIKKAIDTLANNHTIIIIAHRLFTVIDADEIIVFDKGEIAGIGTHETLLNGNYVYQKLYKTEVETININSITMLT